MKRLCFISVLISLFLMVSCVTPVDSDESSEEGINTDTSITIDYSANDGTKSERARYYKSYKIEYESLKNHYSVSGKPSYNCKHIESYEEIFEYVDSSAILMFEKEIFEENEALFVTFYEGAIDGEIVGFTELVFTGYDNQIICEYIKNNDIFDELTDEEDERHNQTDQNYLVLIPKERLKFINLSTHIQIRTQPVEGYLTESINISRALGKEELCIVFDSAEELNDYFASNNISYNYRNNSAIYKIVMHYIPFSRQNEIGYVYSEKGFDGENLELKVDAVYEGGMGEEYDVATVNIVAVPNYSGKEKINISLCRRNIELDITNIECKNITNYLPLIDLIYDEEKMPSYLPNEPGEYAYLATSKEELSVLAEGKYDGAIYIDDIFVANNVLVLYKYTDEPHKIVGFYNAKADSESIFLSGVLANGENDNVRSLSYIIVPKNRLVGYNGTSGAKTVKLELELQKRDYYKHIGRAKTKELTGKTYMFSSEEELFRSWKTTSYPELDYKCLEDNFLLCIRVDYPIYQDIFGYYDFNIKNHYGGILLDRQGSELDDSLLRDEYSYYDFILIPQKCVSEEYYTLFNIRVYESISDTEYYSCITSE